MATLKDIARKARVSESTVSRVLSNSPGISDATRQRVLAIAQELKYHPNAFAQGLAKADSNILGVVIPRISNLYYAQLLQGIQEVAGDYGYNLVLCVTNNDTHQALEYLQMLKAYQARGLIYQNAFFLDEDQKGLEEVGIPAVVISRKIPEDRFYSVVLDEVGESRRATEYLLNLGHRNLAFIGGPLADPWPGQMRFLGFKKALAGYGLEMDPDRFAEGDWTFKSGFLAMKTILARTREIDAVFAACDEMAIGAMKALQSAGFTIPSDISVIGFDGVPLGVMCSPELTTMEQPIVDIGRTAMRMLHRLIQGGEVTSRQSILPCRLVERESCRVRLTSSHAYIDEREAVGEKRGAMEG
ncbi:MAG: LacI family transcriptional regulator [Firmicutes bacterium]|nr:LacI family transcriptional regulator [Bacillota bacterium]